MTYKESDIVHKEGVDAIRQNVAMYVGDSSYNGFHHIASEVIDNSMDEAVAGYAKKIHITLYKDGSCSIEDDGRGIPSEPHPEYKISTLEVILTKIHSSGKYDKNAYKKFSSGIHGIGLKCASGLSEWLKVTVQRDGKKYYQEYSEGKPVAPVKVEEESPLHGTRLHFKPSPKLFRDVAGFDKAWFINRCRDLSYLNPNIEIRLKDERDGFEKVYLSKNGINDYVNELIKDKGLLNQNLNISTLEPDGIVKEDGSQDDMKLELALNYGESDTETIIGFTNNILNRDGGVHIIGFQTALTTAFNNYLKKNEDILTRKEAKELEGKSLRGEDYRTGMAAIVSIKLARPQFAGQTKDRLTNVEVQGAVRVAVGKVLNKWIEENPGPARKIVERAILSFRSHLASKRAIETIKKDSKSLLGGNKKLKDCTEHDPEKSELFIVEGDSAAGSAIDGRDYRYQAVLALGGKILNTWKATTAKMLAHDEIASLIKSLGTGILDNFESGKCRYGKIIIMCDADVDGLHIRTLLLTFFYQQMRNLFHGDRICIAQPPLYKIKHIYGDDKCHHCDFKKNKAIKNCGICNGTKKLTEYITYDSEFYQKMFELGIKGAVLTDLKNGKNYTGSDLQRIITAIKENKINVLAEFGFSPDQINLNTNYVEIPEAKFSVKGSTKAKSVNFTALSEITNAITELGQNSVEITRFKGLGEMGFEELYYTTMDPRTRSLIQVKVADAVEATKKFEILMGPRAETRREFIIQRKAY